MFSAFTHFQKVRFDVFGQDHPAYLTGTLSTDIVETLWAAALFFTNLLPVFGFHCLWFDPVKRAALGAWLKALAGAQTVVSLPLLFFLGLGLRTRFRMR